MLETTIGIGEPFIDEHLVEHPPAGLEVEVSQQAIVLIARARRRQYDIDVVIKKGRPGKRGGFVAKVHRWAAGLRHLRRIHAPQSKARGAPTAIRDIDIERVAVGYVGDAGGLLVISLLIQ